MSDILRPVSRTNKSYFFVSNDLSQRFATVRFFSHSLLAAGVHFSGQQDFWKLMESLCARSELKRFLRGYISGHTAAKWSEGKVPSAGRQEP